MSTGSPHKLFNYEVAPPSNVWEKIAAELEDTAIEYKFPSKLKEYSVVPPDAIWEKITHQLDEDFFEKDYSEKLYTLEIAPPIGTWAKINNGLSDEKAVTFPKSKKIFPLLRYAAAASIIGFLTWGSIQLLNNKPGKAEMVEQVNNIPEVLAGPSKRDQAINELKESVAANIIADTDEARNDAALEASKKTYAKLDLRSNKKIKEVANFYFGEPDFNAATRSIDINEPLLNSEPTITDNAANRYFLLMTPDGNIIRMSKKLGNLVCCVSGEEQDEGCKYQLKKWKLKMANTQTGHSPGNFMDILSLLNSLQEEN